jgi:hypothetical protein
MVFAANTKIRCCFTGNRQVDGHPGSPGNPGSGPYFPLPLSPRINHEDKVWCLLNLDDGYGDIILDIFVGEFKHPVLNCFQQCFDIGTGLFPVDLH